MFEFFHPSLFDSKKNTLFKTTQVDILQLLCTDVDHFKVKLKGANANDVVFFVFFTFFIQATKQI